MSVERETQAVDHGREVHGDQRTRNDAVILWRQEARQDRDRNDTQPELHD